MHCMIQVMETDKTIQNKTKKTHIKQYTFLCQPMLFMN